MEFSSIPTSAIIPRPNEHERLISFLLDQRFFLSVAITTSLPGARGFGKTSLARAVCQDERVRKAFPDGIFWVTLGQVLTPLELLGRIEQLIFDLTGQHTAPGNLADAETQLHHLLEPRQMLLVIDEADNEDALRPFLKSGPGGASLLITHDDACLPLGARRVPVDIMMPEEALALLALDLPVNGERSASNSEATAGDGNQPEEDSEPPAANGEQSSEDAEPSAGDSEQPEEDSQSSTLIGALSAAEAESPAEDGEPLAEGSEPPTAENELPTVGRSPSTDDGSSSPDEHSPFTDPGGEADRLLESLADRLNEWPLLLALANGLLRGCFEPPVAESEGDSGLAEEAGPYGRYPTGASDAGIYQGSGFETRGQSAGRSLLGCRTLDNALRSAHAALDRVGLVSGWRIEDEFERKRALDGLLAACLEPLTPAERERYVALAVFTAGESAPVAAAARLWGLDLAAARAQCQRLARRALIELDAGRDTFSLQAALHACLRDQLWAGQLVALHHRLVEAYRGGISGWADGPDDGYFFQRLASHLGAAGRNAELQALLFDFGWLSRYLQCAETGPNNRRADLISLLGDYELALATALDRQSAQLRLVQEALRLSAPALTHDPRQLAPQLLGRLLPFSEPEIRALVKQAAEWRAGPWLRPLAACFPPPGSDEVRVMLGHDDWVTGVTILPDGQHAVSSSLDGRLRVWDLASGQIQRVIVVTPDAEAPGGPLAPPAPRRTGPLGGTKPLGGTGPLGPPVELRPGGISAVATTPDGHKAITAGWDGTVKIWNLATGQEERSIAAHIEAVGALVITPDGQRIITAADDRLIRVWDLASGQQVFELAGHADVVRALAITPDGRTLISGSWDYTLRVWDLEEGKLMQVMPGHEGWVQALAVSPDGTQALSSSWDRTVRVWDLFTGETVRELTGFHSPVLAMTVTADSRLLVAGGGDGSLALYDLETGEQIRLLSGHAGGINALALTGSGRFAVTGSDDRTLRVWDLVALRGGDLRPAHNAAVYALSSAPDESGQPGQRLVSASWDGTLKVWEPAAGREIRTLSGHSGGVVALAITADGRTALTGGRDKSLRLWDLAEGREIRTLQGHTAAITCAAITPDGRIAASGDDSGMVRVWDAETGQCLAQFTGEAAIWACALTPDGKTITASEAGGKMYFLRIER